MKSICIKTNNSHILDYLQKELNVIELNNICFTCNEFKNYKNIIVHYTGTVRKFFMIKFHLFFLFWLFTSTKKIYLKTLFLNIIFTFQK